MLGYQLMRRNKKEEEDEMHSTRKIKVHWMLDLK